MNSRHKLLLFQISAAVATGILLRFVVGLYPIWWLVWFAPVALLLMAFRFSPQEARWIVTLAAVIGTSRNFRYFPLVMPLPAVIAVIVGQALLWGFLIIATRRLVVRYQACAPGLVPIGRPSAQNLGFPTSLAAPTPIQEFVALHLSRSAAFVG